MWKGKVKIMKNAELKKCKVCGEDVANNAKACPHCGAKQKKKRPILIGILAFVVLIVIIATAGGDDEPKKVGDTTPAQSTESSTAKTEEESKESFGVGEIAELKGVRVSFLGVTENTGSAFNTPTEGNVFVLCEFEVENNSTKEINVSSLISFEGYCDDYACSYSLGALLEKGNKNQLDGTVAVGKKIRGVIGYEIPNDWKELEIVFTPDFWSGKSIKFIANNK